MTKFYTRFFLTEKNRRKIGENEKIHLVNYTKNYFPHREKSSKNGEKSVHKICQPINLNTIFADF